MEDKRFDDIIKGKLTNLTTEDTPQWDLFLEKKKVYDQKRSDKKFDNSLRATFLDYRAEYNPGHWSLLKERLEHIYAVRKQVFMVKSFELVAFLLLAISLGNYVHLLIPDAEKDLVTTANTPIAVIEEQEAKTEETYVFNVTESHVSENTLDNNSKAPIVNSTQIAFEQAEENTSRSSDRRSNRTSSLASVNSASATTGNGSSVNPVETGNVHNASKATAIPSNKRSEKANSYASTKEVALLVAISEIGQENSSLSLVDRSAPAISNHFGIKPAKDYPNNKWLHLNVAFDNNLIYTAYDPIYNENGPTFGEMFGLSVAAIYSIEKKAMEYEFGLGYTSFDKPWNFINKFEEAERRYRYTLSNVHFDIVTAPIKANYHFVSNDDWSLYVSAGLTPGVVVSSDYSEGDIEFIGFKPIRRGEVLPPATPLEDLVAPFQMDRTFTKGLFQGGSLNDNLMLHGSIGFGMQRNISPLTSIYFKGDLYYDLLNKVYGPTNIEQINRFSFGFGIKRKI